MHLLVVVWTVCLLADATGVLLTKLQSIQNAAARLITRTRKFDITPVLRDLHWLPIRRLIEFKIATLVYKCLNGLAPPYLADDCILVSTQRESSVLRVDQHRAVR